MFLLYIIAEYECKNYITRRIHRRGETTVIQMLQVLM